MQSELGYRCNYILPKSKYVTIKNPLCEFHRCPSVEAELSTQTTKGRENDSLGQKVCSNDDRMYIMMVFRLEWLPETVLRKLRCQKSFSYSRIQRLVAMTRSFREEFLEKFRGILESISVHATGPRKGPQKGRSQQPLS
jgi:hypothetical protein